MLRRPYNVYQTGQVFKFSLKQKYVTQLTNQNKHINYQFKTKILNTSHFK